MSEAHILIVDDDPASLLALSEAVHSRLSPVAVDTSASAAAALERMRTTDYDVIVTDIKMPGMDGLALLSRIRELRPETPTLIITGHGQSELPVQALRTGAYDFIQKPVDREYFAASLRRAIRLRQLDRQVQEQRHALERHATELERIVEERTRALREANRAKDEFLALLAHELRNPLAPILNAVKLMQIRGPCDSVLEQARDVVERQVQHMARLLDDLLDVSRITCGKLELRKQRLDLATAMEHSVQISRPLIEARGHELTVCLPPEPVALEADPTRLEEIFANLLNNAAKYTEPGGRICFSAAPEADQAVVRVRDSGIGIRADLLPRIFEPFTRADHSLSRSQSGLGLGLALVRSLVQLHGGSVQASSPGPGQGSEFVVRLPVAPAAAVTPAGPTEAATGDSAGQPMRVLVVDDNVDAANTLEMLLKVWGHEVRVAHSGHEALEVARNFQADAVLLDIGLPGLDGYQVARQLRRQPGMDRALLVAMTGYGQMEDRRRSEQAGIQHHLVKPVDLEALRELLAKQSLAS